jgi:hypothetical protein
MFSGRDEIKGETSFRRAYRLTAAGALAADIIEKETTDV